MHTHTGVRLAISPAPGMPDHVVAMSAPVQARMGALRTCFTSAMQRSPRVGGSTEFELEAKGHATKVRVTREGTGDQALTQCMKRALARAYFARLPRGARARVGVQLNNPLASRAAAAPRQVGAVRMLANGKAESEHGMLEGDIKVRLTGAAHAVPTINRLQEDIATQVSGLLDCRRKAMRGESDFSIAIPLMVRAGSLEHGRPRVSEQAPRAPACVTEWLGRLDTKRLADADLELAIVFRR
ncbi:MAG: hypothetical protein ABW252_07595 [Polyangiales bacterium]